MVSIHQQTMTLGRGTLFAALLLLFAFRLLSGTPLPYVRELEAFVIVVVFGLLFWLYLARLYADRPSFSMLELYVMALQWIPLYSAWRAQEVFGQPLLYGVLTQRYIWVSCIALLLLELLRRGVLVLPHLERALLGLAWLSLAGYAVLQTVGDPAAYADQYPAFATPVGGGEYAFKFETVMLTFGLFYYLLSGLLLRSTRHLVLALPFLMFLLVVVDKRSLDVAVAVSLLWVLWLYVAPARILSMTFSLTALALLAAVLLNLFAPDFIDSATGRFQDALLAVAGGIEGNDASSNARIKEVYMAMPYLQAEWFLGSGDLSDQWADGYAGVMGYFYPSDIGLFGGVFVYGVAGVLFLYAQVLFLRRPARTGRRVARHDLFLVVVYAMVVLLLVQSLIKGGIVFTPAITLVFIAIAYHGRRESQAHHIPARRPYALA